MSLYRITFKLLSSIVTPLKGDTIWGHIVWGIADYEGEAAVTEFLQQEKKQPQLLVSSAFPHGFICKPYPPPSKRTETLNLAKYAEIKKNKKRKYVLASDYFACNNDKHADTISASENGSDCFKSETRMHNSIDRYSNTVMEGNLFEITELWSSTDMFDMYVASTFPPERILELFAHGLSHGFGADASTGRGHLEIIGQAEPVIPKKNGTKYMALAPFVLAHDENRIKDLRADIFVRNGKIGGSFASFMSPYKKTVLLYDEGAVFSSDTELEYVGVLLNDVHADSRICQAGFAPVIPIP